MKYEQAFYTWGENQLSRYKRGQGICASSNLDMEFLDKCLVFGALFEAERLGQTAEFTVYSNEFHAFVGVGISPKADAERRNKLCHFLIPAEAQNDDVDPGSYLLPYPYRQAVEERETLSQMEISPVTYEYDGILQKYNLKGAKLARLLWKAYPCICGESSTLAVVLDRAVHPIEDDAQTAREITWLLAMLVPGTGKRAAAFRRRLSYGVYTTENIKAAALIFTADPQLCENKFYMDAENDDTEKIPAVYCKMAEYAEQSCEQFRNFMEELLKCQYSQRLQTGQLTTMYYDWKLKNGEKLETEEIRGDLNSLLITAGHSAWHKEFLLKFLRQAEGLQNSEMLTFWTRFVMPEMSRYDELSTKDQEEIEQAAERLICGMSEQNQKNYEIFLRNLPANSKKKILLEIYRQEDSCIKKEYDSIRTVEELTEYIKRYGELEKYDEFREEVVSCAKRLYKDADPEIRQQITDSIYTGSILKNDWEEWLESCVEVGENCEEYVGLLKLEIEKMERRLAGRYYRRLLAFAKKAGEGKEELLADCEAKLREKYPKEIQKKDIEEFAEKKLEWSRIRLKHRMITETLGEIAERKIAGLKGRDCKEQWIRSVCEKLKKSESISEEIYGKLLRQMEDVVKAERDGAGEEYIKNYMDALWNAAERQECRTCLEWKMVFRLQQREIREERWKKSFWQEIHPENFEEMEMLKQVFEKRRKEEREKICSESNETMEESLKRRLYLLWEDIREGRRVTKGSLSFINKKMCQDSRNRDLLCEFISEEQKFLKRKEVYLHPYVDAENYFRLQQLLEEQGLAETKESRKRCKEYRKIRDNHKPFAELVKNMQWRNSEDNWIRSRGKEMKLFLKVSGQHNVTKENLQETAKLLECCDTFFEKKDDIEEISELIKGFKKVSEEMKREFRQEHEEIHNKIEAKKEAIKEKQAECEEYERLIREIQRVIVRMNEEITEDVKREEQLAVRERELEEAERVSGVCDSSWGEKRPKKIKYEAEPEQLPEAVRKNLESPWEEKKSAPADMREIFEEVSNMGKREREIEKEAEKEPERIPEKELQRESLPESEVKSFSVREHFRSDEFM